MITFMIRVSPELALALQLKDVATASELLNAISAKGAKLGSPTGSVGEASQYYSIENVDAHSSEALTRVLSAIDGVEAAYAKPADELP
jgi:hypothetical protein